MFFTQNGTVQTLRNPLLRGYLGCRLLRNLGKEKGPKALISDPPIHLFWPAATGARVDLERLDIAAIEQR